MKIRKSFFVSFVLVSMLLGAYYPIADQTEKEAVLVSAIMDGLKRMHFEPKDINDDYSEKVFNMYLERLDGGKRFFTGEDIDKLQVYKHSIDDDSKAGNFDFFNLSQELLKARLELTQNFYRDILSEPFDFTVEEQVETDGEKKEFARNEQDLKESWRLSMKYETLTRLTDYLRDQEKGEDEELKDLSYDELEEKARKDVLKIFDDWYERIFRLKRNDRLSDYLNTLTNIFDPHTGYYEPIDKQNFDINMSGKLEGIGARLQTDKDHTKVVHIVPGGPAWKGEELEADDLILKVTQEGEETVSIKGMQINDVVSLIRGKKDTKVTLTVKKVDGSITDITITRDVVILEEGFAKSLILSTNENEKIGYIKLPRFYADFKDNEGRFCSKDIAIELEKLKEEEVDGIILDLRNNGGGSLRDVVKMTGFFIEEGPVVQVKSRGRKAMIMDDNDPDVQYDGQLIVMVNEFSASASEILAAALQDYNRAIIVGSSSTFGKGTVQRFFDLDRAVQDHHDIKPLGHIKLTTQKFYRINGGTTQFEGVTPDIIFPDNYKYIDTGEKEHDYPLAWDEIEKADFGQKVLQIDNKEAIVEKSNERVKVEPAFQKIEQNALRLQRLREFSQYPLSLEAYKSLDDSLDAEAKKYKLEKEEIEGFMVDNIAKDAAKMQDDEAKKERNKEWIKNVKEDIYLFETMHIMKDLLENEIADSQKK